MAYVSGTASDLTDLRGKIIAACTANGWTLTGAVLSKGTNYLTLTVSGTQLMLLGGTGESGGALTGAAPSAGRVGTLTAGIQALTFPLSYEVFLFSATSEVFVVLNYSGSYYQWLAWGKSQITLPGTGMWFSGSIDARTTTTATLGACVILPATATGLVYGQRGSGALNPFTPALFHSSVVTSAAAAGEYIHHALGAETWSATVCTSAQYRFPLDRCLPSAWSSDAVLLPIQVFSGVYGSSKVAMVLEVGNARACRIDNFAPGAVVTLGADRWKIYPWYLKSSADPTGAAGNSSGCSGWAIRYDGP